MAVAGKATLPMEFSRQEYWSGFPFSSPWDPLNPGIETRSIALQVDALLPEPPGKPTIYIYLPIYNPNPKPTIYTYIVTS